MRILYLEPFWGGSHRNVAEALAKHLQGCFIQFCRLPARFWKWRMRAASFDFLKQLEALAASEGLELGKYLASFDLVFASALFDIAQFKGLLPLCPPLLAYFHENQLSYPQPKQKIDFHFGLTNISSALAADAVAFNSEFQRQQFLDSIRPFLQALPDKRPMWSIERIREKSQILHLGIEEDFLLIGKQRRNRAEKPVILWNHRWEFDKQPEVFFAALRALKQRTNLPFQLVVLGENFQVHPQIFEQAKAEFAAEILRWGFAENNYLYWLSQCDVVVSCAIQENFGIAVLEAVAAGAQPLLPRRLSYPELFSGLPEHDLKHIFYDNFEELVSGLCYHLSAPHSLDILPYLTRFIWAQRIPDFQNYFHAIAKT